MLWEVHEDVENAHSSMGESRHASASFGGSLLARALVALPSLLVASVACVCSMRYVMLIYEMWELVVAERTSDRELLDLCADGAAQRSNRMRSACMEAMAAQASPLVVDVLFRSSRVFASEIVSLFSQPVQSLSMAGAVGVMGILPWLPNLKSFIASAASRALLSPNSTSGSNDRFVIVCDSHAESAAQSAAMLHPRSLPYRDYHFKRE